MRTLCKALLVFTVFSLALHAEIRYVSPGVEEIQLIEFVKESIQKAHEEISKLDPDIYRIVGASSPKVRRLLNNLCSKSNTCYLEIGCWKGSTLISALYKNQSSIDSAVAVDIAPDVDLLPNTTKFLPPNSFQFYSANCFTIDPLSIIFSPINVYFYDGEHYFIDQERAFTHYNSVFDNLFIAVIDDWNWDMVKNGTYSAFDKLNYTILYENELPARFNGDQEQWWNGIYIAVIRKP